MPTLFVADCCGLTATIYTKPTMYTDGLTATWAGPTVVFVHGEGPQTFLFYKFEVFEHAHLIFCPVAFIELFQSAAGVRRAFIAKSRGCECPFFAVDNYAVAATFGFGSRWPVATRAMVFLPLIGHAQGTVHTAWGYQVFVYFGWLFHGARYFDLWALRPCFMMPLKGLA